MKIVRIGMANHRRKVGERGQVTIPKELRDRYGINSGDEIEFIELNHEIVLKPSTDEERMAEGYQKRADRSRKLVKEMDVASSEANEYLGDAPGWCE